MADVTFDLDGLGSLQTRLSDLREQYSDPTGDWLVGTGVEYAIYVDRGTRDQDPQPFFTTALVEARADLEGFVRRNTRTTLEAQDTADEVVQVVALALERRMKQLAPVDTGTLRASIKAVRNGTPGDLPTADEVDPDAETEVSIG